MAESCYTNADGFVQKSHIEIGILLLNLFTKGKFLNFLSYYLIFIFDRAREI